MQERSQRVTDQWWQIDQKYRIFRTGQTVVDLVRYVGLFSWKNPNNLRDMLQGAGHRYATQFKAAFKAHEL